MYPNEPTHGEELIEAIRNNAPDTTKIIKEYIESHDTSKMVEGVRYYFNQSDIVDRKMYTYENDVKTIDEEATNNKLPASWHKRLVDQKVSYLAGKPTTLTSEEENDPNQERIEALLGDEFDDTMPELIKHASNKGREWLHPYIDKEGNFDYIIVPAQEGIPIYDNTKRKNLEAFIRYYDLDDETRKIELWDSEQVTYYEQTSSGDIVIDVNYDVNPQGHFFYGNEEKVNQYGWNKVPFIEFKNNEEAVNDLTFYKQLIDGFELINSDTANTLEDMQSIVWVLRGYEGTDLKSFNADVQKYKVVALSDEQGAGFDAVRADVPVQAVDSYLDRMSRLIYEAGQGVDFSSDSFGQNPSGVALKFLYTALDMKANVLERKFNKGLKQLLWFICEYLKIAENATIDYTKYSFVFNKSLITNELEQITMAQNSVGLISSETIAANHPWVEDIQLELERKKKEDDEYMRNMPEIGEGENNG